MAYIRVAYKTKNVDFDYVPGNRLETLIARDEISHFFRPAEKRWVSVKFDATRRAQEDSYGGRERRGRAASPRPADRESGNPGSRPGADGTNWLEGLWRQIVNPSNPK